jgi:hypothetical protein
MNFTFYPSIGESDQLSFLFNDYRATLNSAGLDELELYVHTFGMWVAYPWTCPLPLVGTEQLVLIRARGVTCLQGWPAIVARLGGVSHNSNRSLSDIFIQATETVLPTFLLVQMLPPFILQMLLTLIRTIHRSLSNLYYIIYYLNVVSSHAGNTTYLPISLFLFLLIIPPICNQPMLSKSE